MRLDRYLSNMGLGSRKSVRALISGGSVTVDGIRVTEPDRTVSEGVQKVCLDGKEISYKPYVYIMMNKPAGYISSTDDGDGTPVTDLLDGRYLHYGPGVAGRLDKDTEGLLLLTNDGQFIHRVISPSKNVIKKYYAELMREITSRDVVQFNKGIELRDGTVFRSATLEHTEPLREDKNVPAAVTGISEGKFHQVKKMFLATGNEVLYLRRLSIGGLSLDPKLSLGEYRELSPEEAEKVFEQNG